MDIPLPIIRDNNSYSSVIKKIISNCITSVFYNQFLNIHSMLKYLKDISKKVNNKHKKKRIKGQNQIKGEC